ncbi:beta strand repeat-containing protein, partial [Limnohabitans radicicola]
MSTILRYFISGSFADLLDLRTPGAEYALAEQQLIATGSGGVNTVWAAAGVDLDARNLFGGTDVVLFNHRWDQYTKDITSVSGAIVFSYTDSTSGLTEKVTVANGATTLGRDQLIFADGAVGTQQANAALQGSLTAALASVSGVNNSLTSAAYSPTAPAGNTLRAFASTTSTTTGATFAMTEAGQTTVATGTGQVDKVYVKAGATVDARNLFGGEDQIYLTGNWADYTKSLTEVSGAITFTRSINGGTEKVTVANGATTLGRDKLVFADGAVLTHNARTALTADLNAALSAVTGFDTATQTPFLAFDFSNKTPTEIAAYLNNPANAAKLGTLSTAQGQQTGPDDLDQVNTTAFAALSTDFIDGLSAQVVASLPNELLAVMTSAQAAVADLSGLTGPQVLQLRPDAIDSVPNAVLSALTAAQVAALSNEQLAAFSDAQVALLNLSLINSDQAAAMATAGNLDNLSAAQVQSLAPTAIDSVPNAVLSALTAAQVAALSNEQLAAFSDAQVALLNLSLINSDQAAAMASAGNLDNLSAAQVQSLAPTAIDSVPNAVLSALTAAQVAALSNEQLAAFSDAQVALLNLSLINSDQAAAMATAGNLDNLSAAQVAQLSPAAIDSVPNAVLSALTAAQVAALSNEQLAAFSDAQVALLNLSLINSDQAAAMASAGNLDNLSAAQVLSLLPEAIDSVPAGVIDNLSPTQVANLSLQQVQALTGAQLQALAEAGLLDNLSHSLSAQQLTDPASGLGLDLQTVSQTALMNSVIDSVNDANQALIDSAAKINGIADVVQSLSALAAMDPTDPNYAMDRDALGLTDGDFAALGISGVTADNLNAVLYQIAVSADNGSGIASLSAIRTLIAPDAITNLSLSVGDTGASSSDRLTNAASLTFSGTARQGASVSVWVDADGDNVVDNGETQTVTADVNTGVFTATATATVANGLVRATATQTDGTGTSPVSQTLVIERDTAVPTFQGATVNGDQLVLAYSHPLDATNLPDLNKYSVRLEDGTIAPPSIAVNARSVSGNIVVLTLATPVNAGQVISVSYTDADNTDNATGALQDRAGNDVTNLVNQAVTNATGDTRTLAAPTISLAGEVAGALNATEAADGTTVVVNLAGTGARANDTVQLRWAKAGGSTETVTLSLTGTHISSGSATVTVPQSAILSVGDGTVSVDARLVKAGFDATANGAASAYSSAQSLTVAAQPSAIGLTFDLLAADDLGNSNSDKLTSITTGLTLTGTTASGNTVEFFDDFNNNGQLDAGESLGSVTADATGIQRDITLSKNGLVNGTDSGSLNGVHNIRAKVTDTQGNFVITNPLAITIDTTRPAAPTAINLAAADDSGVLGDLITNQTTGLTLTGTTAANGAVRVFKDSNNNGQYDAATDTLLASGTANGSGAFSVDLSGSFTPGTHSVLVQGADSAAGAQSQAAVVSLNIDTVLPTLQSVAAAAGGNTITLQFSEPIDTSNTALTGLANS